MEIPKSSYVIFSMGDVQVVKDVTFDQAVSEAESIMQMHEADIADIYELPKKPCAYVQKGYTVHTP